MHRTPATRGIVLAVGTLLAACAAPGARVQPADLPFHTGDGRSVLHWRLDRLNGRVEAVGLAVVASPELVAELVLELQGLDRNGQPVTRAVDWVRPSSFTGTEPWPFTVRLRATGLEDRWALRVRHYVPKPYRGR